LIHRKCKTVATKEFDSVVLLLADDGCPDLVVLNFALDQLAQK